MTPARELPIVGGHLVLDFANTVDDPDGPERWDHIANAEGLLHWAGRIGLMANETGKKMRSEQEEAETIRLVSAAHQVREAINEVFGAIADAVPVPIDAWDRLRPFVVEAASTASLVPTNAVRTAYCYDWAHLNDLRAVIHPVAWGAGQLLTSSDLNRLKRCGRCPWLFLDYSKNHSRRWCDMNDCARAEKIERYLAKRAVRRGANPG